MTTKALVRAGIMIAGILALAPARASACIGAGAFLVIPLAMLCIFAPVVMAGLALKSQREKPIVSQPVDTLLVLLTAPLALCLSAWSMQATGNPGGGAWSCTFADSAYGQIGFHIVTPLLFTLAALWLNTLARPDAPKPSLDSVAVWVVLGLWVVSFWTAMVSFQLSSLTIARSSRSPLLWRLLHYSNIVALCGAVFVMPQVGRRVKSKIGLAVIGCGFAFVAVTMTVLGR